MIENGIAGEEIQFYPDRVKARHCGLSHSMNTTDAFHTCRVSIKRGDFKVYVDGELKIDGTGRSTLLTAAASKSTEPHAQRLAQNSFLTPLVKSFDFFDRMTGVWPSSWPSSFGNIDKAAVFVRLRGDVKQRPPTRAQGWARRWEFRRRGGRD